MPATRKRAAGNHLAVTFFYLARIEVFLFADCPEYILCYKLEMNALLIDLQLDDLGLLLHASTFAGRLSVHIYKMYDRIWLLIGQ